MVNKVEETVEIVRSYLHEMHELGVASVEESEVVAKTGYARKESTGYARAMKKLGGKELGHVVKSKGQLSLTQEGLRFIEQNGLKIKVKPLTNVEHQESLKDSIKKNAKAPEKAIDAIWNTLCDGKAHTAQDLYTAAGYQRKESTGYSQTMKWLKKFDLVEKEGQSWKFTDKVFRYGSRPN